MSTGNQKTQPPKKELPNEEMGTWIKQGIFKGIVASGREIHKEVFIFPGYKRDVSQNNT
jgi:hypothetical protein